MAPMIVVPWLTVGPDPRAARAQLGRAAGTRSAPSPPGFKCALPRPFALRFAAGVFAGPRASVVWSVALDFFAGRVDGDLSGGRLDRRRLRQPHRVRRRRRGAGNLVELRLAAPVRAGGPVPAAAQPRPAPLFAAASLFPNVLPGLPNGETVCAHYVIQNGACAVETCPTGTFGTSEGGAPDSCDRRGRQCACTHPGYVRGVRARLPPPGERCRVRSIVIGRWQLCSSRGRELHLERGPRRDGDPSSRPMGTWYALTQVVDLVALSSGRRPEPSPSKGPGMAYAGLRLDGRQPVVPVQRQPHGRICALPSPRSRPRLRSSRPILVGEQAIYVAPGPETSRLRGSSATLSLRIAAGSCSAEDPAVHVHGSFQHGSASGHRKHVVRQAALTSGAL